MREAHGAGRAACTSSCATRARPSSAACPPAAGRRRPRGRTRSAPSRSRPCRRHALRAAVERLRDQLRAEADAEHRHAARVRRRDHLALALERRVAVGAVRVDDAAEHDQPVELARGRLGLRERLPRRRADAERRQRRLERGERGVEVVLDDEHGRIRVHALIFAHRRAGSAAVAKVCGDAYERAAGDGAPLHRLGVDLPGDPRLRRDDAAARLGRRALPARRRAHARRAGRARPPRRAAVAGARSAARW